MMTWEAVETARRDLKQAELSMREAERWLNIVRTHTSEAERDYLKEMGVEYTLLTRDPPLFPSHYEVHLNGKHIGTYLEFSKLVQAVREAELAGYVPVGKWR